MPGSAMEWQKVVRGASTEGRIIAAVQEYVATMSAGELASLPETCRPPAVLDAESISAINVELARHELLFVGDEATKAALRDLLLVFSAASARLAQIAYDRQTLGPRTDPGK